jgi:hypothetical protein
MPSPLVAAAVTAALLSAAGCAHATCTGFALSLADHGGQSTPVAAAEWFAAQDNIATVPRAGWHEAGHDATGVVLESGQATLHAFQGPDQTWQVDSGKTC